MKSILWVATFLLIASTGLAQVPPEEKFSVTPQLEHELVDTITRLAEKRRLAAPHGYEKDEAFFREFVGLRSEIGRTLQKTDTLLFNPYAFRKIAAEALDAYRSNYSDFASFYSKNLADDSVFRGQTIEEIAGQLLTLYVVVYSRNETLADKLKWGTYIWPFCRPKGYEKSAAFSPEDLFYAIMNIKSSGASIATLAQFTNGKVFSRPLTPSELTLWKGFVPPEIILALSSPIR